MAHGEMLGMISPKTIPVPLSYQALRASFIAQTEGLRGSVYLDSEGFATIGIGFNLHDATVRNSVYTRMLQDHPGNEGEASYLQNLSPVFSATYPSSAALVNAIRSVPIPEGAVTFRMSSGQIRDVFDTIVPSYETIVDGKLTMPQSYERLSLVSLAYNNPSLIGPGLLSAIKVGHRAEAWYEIRYGSNLKLDSGLENRRYYESDVFGVTNSHTPLDPSSFLVSEALGICEMHSRHLKNIEYYSMKFGEPTTHYVNPIIPINKSIDIFANAIDKVCEKYNVSHTAVIMDYRPITNGVWAANEVNKLTCVGYDVTNGARMLAKNGNNAVFGSIVADTIYTGIGNDKIYSGGGDDFIYDTGGANRLEGGSGNDTYTISFDAAGRLPVIVEAFDHFDSWDTLVLKGNPSTSVVLAKFQNVEEVKYAGNAPANLTIVNGNMTEPGFENFPTDANFSFGSRGGSIRLVGVYAHEPDQINLAARFGKGADTLVIDRSVTGPADEFDDRDCILDVFSFQSGVDKIDLSAFDIDGLLLSGTRPTSPGIFAIYSPGDEDTRGAVEVLNYDIVSGFPNPVAVSSWITIDMYSGFLSSGDIII
jgi:GH24 family phage-related lysozyme (muramidase)